MFDKKKISLTHSGICIWLCDYVCSLDIGNAVTSDEYVEVILMISFVIYEVIII